MHMKRNVFITAMAFTLIAGTVFANNAFQIRSDAAHNTILQTKNPFTRGNNLIITFKVWGDPGLVPLSAGSWNGPALATGFWNANIATDYFNSWACEHIIVGWPGATGAWGDQGSNQYFHAGVIAANVPIQLSGQQPVILSTAFNAAYEGATDKAHCVSYRFTVGNTNGAKFEWSDNSQATWTTEYNLIDTAGMPDNDANLYLGWVTANGGGTHGLMIDDIVVQQNGSTIFSEDWESGTTLDTTKWVIINNTNIAQIVSDEVASPTPSPTPSPTASPTPSPTASPTPSVPVTVSNFALE